MLNLCCGCSALVFGGLLLLDLWGILDLIGGLMLICVVFGGSDSGLCFGVLWLLDSSVY